MPATALLAATEKRQISGTDLWVETNQNAKSAIRSVEKLLTAFGHDIDEPGFIPTRDTMTDYYTQNLSAERLRRCYEIAPQRIRQYLQAEIETVSQRIKLDDWVLELGCGYGRVMKALSTKTTHIVGIDLSFANLKYARDEYLGGIQAKLLQMDAVHLGFAPRQFDLVFCIQNGISAFGVDPSALIAESIRVTRPGGIVLFSSYSPKIWDARLAWFRLQAEHGLIGEIDFSLTGNGVIICKDGFRATTFDESAFKQLTNGLDKDVRRFEVDHSSLFCEIIV